jgi:hypothetical protein
MVRKEEKLWTWSYLHGFDIGIEKEEGSNHGKILVSRLVNVLATTVQHISPKTRGLKE